MSLHHTSIYLTGPLRFEINKALLGGAIYIATIKYSEIVVDSHCIIIIHLNIYH